MPGATAPASSPPPAEVFAEQGASASTEEVARRAERGDRHRLPALPHQGRPAPGHHEEPPATAHRPGEPRSPPRAIPPPRCSPSSPGLVAQSAAKKTVIDLLASRPELDIQVTQPSQALHHGIAELLTHGPARRRQSAPTSRSPRSWRCITSTCQGALQGRLGQRPPAPHPCRDLRRTPPNSSRRITRRCQVRPAALPNLAVLRLHVHRLSANWSSCVLSLNGTTRSSGRPIRLLGDHRRRCFASQRRRVRQLKVVRLAGETLLHALRRRRAGGLSGSFAPPACSRRQSTPRRLRRPRTRPTRSCSSDVARSSMLSLPVTSGCLSPSPRTVTPRPTARRGGAPVKLHGPRVPWR